MLPLRYYNNLSHKLHQATCPARLEVAGPPSLVAEDEGVLVVEEEGSRMIPIW